MQENALKFEHITEEEKQKRGILGVLFGPVASIVKSTRNGRKYSEQLWEKVFKDPIVNEFFEKGGLPLELDHPVDRDETCSERIAAMMPKKPMKDKDGHLVARIDIIDTPMGRIANTLAKYGFQLGISSRGNGDTITDFDGNESVDPDTYELKAWDLVLLPAVKDARLSLVESLNGKNLKQALKEELDRANSDEKKVMLETLDSLNIDYNSVPTTSQEEVDNIDEESEKNIAANDVGADLTESLQEALVKNKQLEEQIADLQSKLSVCYTKEINNSEKMQQYRSTIISLTESVKKLKALKNKNELNTAELNKQYVKVENLNKLIESLKNENNSLKKDEKLLRQTLKERDLDINSLCEQLRELENSKDSLNESLNQEIESIKEDFNFKLKSAIHQSKAKDSLIESLKNKNLAMSDKYIKLQANMLGVTDMEIKNKLKENYSLDDVDSVCETLQDYTLNISKLPFSTNSIKKQDIRLTESNEPILRNKQQLNIDDEVDSDLVRLSKFMIN